MKSGRLRFMRRLRSKLRCRSSSVHVVSANPNYAFCYQSHMSKGTTEPCLHCGAMITTNSGVSLRTIMLLGKVAPTEYVETISKAEGISRELAQEFVNHMMGHDCIKTEPPRPQCGTPLKTWHARSCLNLKCDWQRDANRPLSKHYK